MVAIMVAVLVHVHCAARESKYIKNSIHKCCNVTLLRGIYCCKHMHLFRQGVVTAMLRIHDNTDIDKGESEGTLTSVFVTSEKIDCESSWVTGCPKACNLTQCMLEKSLKLAGKKVTGQRMSGNWE